MKNGIMKVRVLRRLLTLLKYLLIVLLVSDIAGIGALLYVTLPVDQVYVINMTLFVTLLLTIMTAVWKMHLKEYIDEEVFKHQWEDSRRHNK